MSLESFGPNVLEFWRKASKEPQRVKVGPRNLATALRHRLYRARNQMKKARHELYPAAARVVLRVVPGVNEATGETEYYIEAAHGDTELEALLSEFAPETAPEDLLEDTPEEKQS